MENYIGLNIKYLCSKEKITQKQLGAVLDIKQSTLAGYVGGRTEPNVAMLQKFSKHFDITIDDFINVNLESYKYTDAPKALLKTAEPKSDYAITNDKLYKAQEKTIYALEKQVALLEKTVDSLEIKLAQKAS